MAQKVSETEELLAALKPIPDAVRPPPKVVGVMFELGDDEAGDPAAFITVLLDDGTPETDWVSAKLEPIADVVRKAVHERGVGRWPYVRFARVSDAGGPDADAPAWRKIA